MLSIWHIYKFINSNIIDLFLFFHHCSINIITSIEYFRLAYNMKTEFLFL